MTLASPAASFTSPQGMAPSFPFPGRWVTHRGGISPPPIILSPAPPPPSRPLRNTPPGRCVASSCRGRSSSSSQRPALCVQISGPHVGGWPRAPALSASQVFSRPPGRTVLRKLRRPKAFASASPFFWPPGEVRAGVWGEAPALVCCLHQPSTTSRAKKPRESKDFFVRSA